MKYNVLLRPELTVKITDVEATSQTEAIERAIRMLDSEGIRSEICGALGGLKGKHFEYAELSEDVTYVLVDEVGDEEFENSNWYEMKGGSWLPWLRPQG